MSSPLKALDPAPGLSDRCYESLLAAILAGELDARRTHTQESLAARLGVSRQPVMHALQRLRREGLLVAEDNGRGLRIAPINAAFIQNLYQLREALDALAASAAAATPRPELRDTGATLIRAGREAARRRDPGALAAALDAAKAFQMFIYRASHNPLLIDAVSVNQHHCRRIFVSLSPAIRTPARPARTKPSADARTTHASGQQAADGATQGPSLAIQALRRGWTRQRALLAAIVNGDLRAAERAAREHARDEGQAALAMLFHAALRS